MMRSIHGSLLPLLPLLLSLLPGCGQQAQAIQAPTPAATTSVASAPAGGCLVNDYGIKKKAITTQPGVRCTDQQDAGPLVGAPLKFFRPYFVFDAQPAAGTPQHFLLGSTPRRDSIIGWVSAAHAAPWPTRVGVRPIDPAGQRVPDILFYPNRDALEEILNTGSTSQQPIARARATAGSAALMPWPVADLARVTVRGTPHELLHVYFLGELRAGQTDPVQSQPASSPGSAAAYSPEELTRFGKQIRMLDLIFVVDNTSSTRPFIQGIRDAVVLISRKLAQLPSRPDIRFGLVLYRDYVDSIMFATEKGPSVVWNVPQAGDIESFVRTVAPLQAAEQSSVDYAEAGYDGLLAGLTGTEWRGDGRSHRVMVLLANNSLHEPGEPKNPNGIGLARIASEAASRNVRVFTLPVAGPGGPDERERLSRQLGQIAASCNGRMFPLEDAAKVVEQIQTILETETAEVHKHTEVFGGLSKGQTLPQVAANTDLPIHEVTRIVELLQRKGIDPARLSAAGPTFSSGWALAEYDGKPLLERAVFIERSELQILIGQLNVLCGVMTSPTFATDIFRRSVGDRIGGSVDDPMAKLAEFFSGDVPVTFDVFLQAQGIPAGRTSLLRLSESDIRHMSQENRQLLADKISRTITPALVNLRNNSSLWTKVDSLEFGWIPEEMLP